MNAEKPGSPSANALQRVGRYVERCIAQAAVRDQWPQQRVGEDRREDRGGHQQHGDGAEAAAEQREELVHVGAGGRRAEFGQQGAGDRHRDDGVGELEELKRGLVAGEFAAAFVGERDHDQVGDLVRDRRNRRSSPKARAACRTAGCCGSHTGLRRAPMARNDGMSPASCAA